MTNKPNAPQPTDAMSRAEVKPSKNELKPQAGVQGAARRVDEPEGKHGHAPKAGMGRRTRIRLRGREE